MAERTEYSMNKRRTSSGIACTNCGMTYKKCSEGLFKRAYPCCNECEETDTHDERRVNATSTTQGASVATMSAAMQSVLNSIPSEVLQAEVNRRRMLEGL